MWRKQTYSEAFGFRGRGANVYIYAISSGDSRTMSAKLAALTTCITIIVSALSFLAACSHDSRTTDMARCVAQVQSQVSQGQLNSVLNAADSEEERHDKIGAVVADCMRKAGYTHANRDMTDGRCLDDVDFSPYCYRRG